MQRLCVYRMYMGGLVMMWQTVWLVAAERALRLQEAYPEVKSPNATLPCVHRIKAAGFLCCAWTSTHAAIC
jgi:hypothetical protein